ncbi:MAG TPA: tRNA (adenosine(37)-N6)-threonylcarbamoyltransferase complex dimerization subunit type 1 TsaB [Chryseosolibacter sp.]
MSVILSLETSTDVCSVALHDNQTLLFHSEIHEPQAHAARLAVMIGEASRRAGVAMKSIDAVAVTSGPGSYTGLRIGTSTAKGLCYALDIPLIAVGSLELLAFQGSSHNKDRALLCPMIDARRMEVYCLVADDQLSVIEPVAAKVIDGNSFQELLATRQVLFFGNGADKCREVLSHPSAAFLQGVYPSAAALGVMAARKFEGESFEDLVSFKPFYLKEFVAKKAGGVV